MRKSIVSFVGLLMVIVLVGCTTPAPNQADPMKQVPDTGMMTEMTATMLPESKMDDMKPTDGMMKPTDDMMKSTDDMMKPTEGMMSTEMPATAAKTDMPGDQGMMTPGWVTAELMHPVTGAMFTINDFQGSVVLVEPFAQWCSTCLAQQKELVKLYEATGMDAGLVIVGLDIDPNEDAEMLKTYLEKHGFSWHYAIASKEMAREISQLYGDQFLNPPSAPMLLIDRQGEVHSLPFGLKSVDDLQKTIEPFMKDGM
jgi:cytochrome oxidase Cu insertion factor (SCO1/SenC/PrrC family)